MTANPTPDSADTTGMVVTTDELRVIEALRAGDEAAFVSLVDQYHASLVRLAMLYVRSQPVAEEVAQETWLGVLNGINRFEGRSSLKTWIFRILTNCAKTRGKREGRSIPFSAMASADIEHPEPAVDPGRFHGADHPRAPHHWASPPTSWGQLPEERLLAGETRSHIQDAIDALPPSQREVITLRDIEGWTSEEERVQCWGAEEG